MCIRDSLGNAHQAFHRVIGITHHPTAQEKPFDIVAAIELHGEVYKLGHRQRGTRQVVAAAVDAVGADVYKRQAYGSSCLPPDANSDWR